MNHGMASHIRRFYPVMHVQGDGLHSACSLLYMAGTFSARVEQLPADFSI